MTAKAALPHAGTTVLPAGRPTSVPVTITNPGPLPLSVGVDARTADSRSMPLTPLKANPTDTGATLAPTSGTVSLPRANPVVFLVPPGADSVTATSSSTVANQIELTSPVRGVDVFGSLGTAQAGATVSTAAVRERTPTVAPGVWTAVPQEIGPFGAGGAAAASATLTASVRAPAFDRTVTSPDATDPYLPGVDPGARSSPFSLVSAGGPR